MKKEPPEKKKPAPVSEGELKVGTYEQTRQKSGEVNIEAERRRRVFECVRDYLRHGHSTFRARQIQAEGAALQKGRTVK